ncbi:hypothetical protein [Sphingopyxis terrae]
MSGAPWWFGSPDMDERRRGGIDPGQYGATAAMSVGRSWRFGPDL